MYSTPVLSCLPRPQFILHPPLLALCPQKRVMVHVTQGLPCLLDSCRVWSPGGTSRRSRGRGETEVGHSSQTPSQLRHGVTPEVAPTSQLQRLSRWPSPQLSPSRDLLHLPSPASSYLSCGDGFPLLLVSQCLNLPSDP